MKTKKKTIRKSSGFDTPCLVMQLHMTTRAITRLYNRFLSKSGIDIGEQSLLVAITKLPDKSITEMADLLFFDRTTLVRNTKRLVKRGFITKRPDTGRPVYYDLTKLGARHVEASMALWFEVQKTLEHSLDNRDADGVRDALVDLRLAIQSQH